MKFIVRQRTTGLYHRGPDISLTRCMDLAYIYNTEKEEEAKLYNLYSQHKEMLEIIEFKE